MAAETKRRRIDNLTADEVVTLDFGAYTEPATFLRIEGTGNDRKAFFRSDGDGSGAYEWAAYRHGGYWVYGSGADRLKLVEEDKPELPRDVHGKVRTVGELLAALLDIDPKTPVWIVGGTVDDQRMDVIDKLRLSPYGSVQLWGQDAMKPGDRYTLDS